MFTIKLQQEGDSLSLAIPAATVERLGLQAGQDLTLTGHAHGFTVATPEPEGSLQMRLARQVLREQAETLKALAAL